MSWFLSGEMFFPGFCRQENVFPGLCSCLQTSPFVSFLRDIFPYLLFGSSEFIVISLICKKNLFMLKNVSLHKHSYSSNPLLLWESISENTLTRRQRREFPRKQNQTKWAGALQCRIVICLFLFDRWISAIKRLVHNQILYIL